MDTRHAAQFLAAFSLGLGALELLAPRKVGRTLGLKGSANLIRACGIREIVSGLGLLSGMPGPQRDLKPWLWGRVGGDALDTAILIGALAPSNKASNRQRRNVVLTIVALTPIIALDIWSALRLTKYS